MNLTLIAMKKNENPSYFIVDRILHACFSTGVRLTSITDFGDSGVSSDAGVSGCTSGISTQSGLPTVPIQRHNDSPETDFPG